MDTLGSDRAVLGFAVHWPGTTVRIGTPSRKSVASRLEGYRRHHVSVRGWSDIAYQVAFDPSGRVWDCRGIKWRSAANGSDRGNDSYGAVLLLLGPGDPVTDDMLNAVRDWRRYKWLQRYPGATKVVGHQDIRPDPTACPGPASQALVASGAFTKGATMALTDADATKAANATLGQDTIPMSDYRKPREDGKGYEPLNPDNPTTTVRGMFDGLYRRTWEILHYVQGLAEVGASNERQLSDIRVRVESIERQLSQLLAVGVNEQLIAERMGPALADAVATELGQRLGADQPEADQG